LRRCCLTLRCLPLSLLLGLPLSVLLRKMPADHAATDRANYRVVPRIVTGHSADDRALETACGVCLACRREGRRRCNQGDW
jgi:hypothetical protein